MSRALFVSHTAELGGAELFLIDMVRDGPPGWRGAFLADGPAARVLEKTNRLAGVVSAGAGLQQIRRGGGASLSAVGDVWSAAVRLGRLARDYDVVCANSQKALFICALACAFARRPLVWVLHDIITDPSFSRLNRAAAVVVANLFARRIVANSRPTAEAFVKAGGKAGAVRIVYNGFDAAAHPQRSADAGRTLRRQFDLDDRPVVALFGRLTPWKGQAVLLRALANMPDVQGLIVGGPLFGEEAYEAELMALATSLNLDRRVRFTGFRDDVPMLMAGTDVLVHASTHAEPFGRVIVEGQMAGLPVIATDAGGVLDIIQDGETGLLVPTSDTGALTDAIRSLIFDPGLSARIAARGRDSAIAQFGIETSRTDLAATFAQATDNIPPK